MTTKTTSILQPSFVSGSTKEKKDTGITENVKKQFLEFWVAGYSQTIPGIHFNRQNYHKTIAENFESDNFKHHISLVAEPANKHDRFAIKIYLDMTNKTPSGQWTTLQYANIGYVPKAISRSMTHSLNRFTRVQIIRCKDKVHDKFYNCKIGCWYDPNKEPLTTIYFDKSQQRFKKIAKFI